MMFYLSFGSTLRCLACAAAFRKKTTKLVKNTLEDVFDRPGVARAVLQLQTVLILID